MLLPCIPRTDACVCPCCCQVWRSLQSSIRHMTECQHLVLSPLVTRCDVTKHMWQHAETSAASLRFGPCNTGIHTTAFTTDFPCESLWETHPPRQLHVQHGLTKCCSPQEPPAYGQDTTNISQTEVHKRCAPPPQRVRSHHSIIPPPQRVHVSSQDSSC